MEFKNDNSFGVIPNKMFAFDTKYFCDNDEKMVYLELWFLQSIGNMGGVKDSKLAIVNLDLLTYTLGWETPTKESRGRKRVADALNSLNSKGYIYFTGELTHSSRNALTIIILGMDYEHEVFVDIEWSDNIRKFTGYSKIMASDYNRLKQGYDLTLFLYTKWRENVSYKISYVEWGKVLNVSDRQARTIIENTGSIVKEQGSYNKETSKNDTNSYKSQISSNKDKNKTVKSKEKVLSNEQKVLSDEEFELTQRLEERKELDKLMAERKRIKESKEETVVIDEPVEYTENVLTQEEEDDLVSGLIRQNSFDKVMGNLDDEEEESGGLFQDLMSQMNKPVSILESEMKKVTDRNVKGDIELLRKIQDKSVRMDYQTYKTIRDSKDFKVNQLGLSKIESICSNPLGLESMKRFEQKYNEQVSKRQK